MDEIERRLRALDEIPSPDLWSAAGDREPRAPEPGPSRIRRGVTIVVAFAVFGAASFLGWTALREGPEPSTPAVDTSPLPAGEAANVAEVVCTSGGTYLLTPVVALQGDGLHVHVRNDAKVSLVAARDPQDVGSNWAVELPDGPSHEFVMRYQPGTFRIGCVASSSVDFHEAPLDEWAPLSVVDPNGYWSVIVEEDTCGQELPPPAVTAGQPAPLAGPISGRLLLEAWSDAGRGDILSVNADGSAIEELFVGPGEHWNPTWAPDRSRVAFVSSEGMNDDGEIFVMNTDGTGLTQLTDNEWAADDLITWSPDGSRLLFRSNRDLNMGLYVMNADGSDQHALAIPGDTADSPAWSPDGSMIAFVGTPASGEPGGCPPDMELFAMSADGSNLVRLTDDELYQQAPAWSPDGSHIAFTASNQDDYRWDVFTIGADGTDLRRLTDYPGIDTSPVWSPDGTMIAFSSDREAAQEQITDNEGAVGGTTLYVMNADGSGAQPLLDDGAIFGDDLHELFVAEWRGL